MKIGFVGSGNMAEAIAGSLLDAGLCGAGDIYMSDIDADRLKSLAAALGVNTSLDNREVVEASNPIVLAVKPQELDGVLAGVAASAAGKLFVSIAAGKRVSYFRERLPGARVIRVMPNLACQVGEGMSAYCGGDEVERADYDLVARLLECSGKAIQLEERLFDAVTALSGSGPAFFAYVLDVLAEGAVREGMARDDALMLAQQTMLGTARVLREGGDAPGEFMARVASKGGTTAAGLSVLKESDLNDVLHATIKAAADRSRELSG